MKRIPSPAINNKQNGSFVKKYEKSIPKAVVIDNGIRKSFGEFMKRICRGGLASPKFVAKEPAKLKEEKIMKRFVSNQKGTIGTQRCIMRKYLAVPIFIFCLSFVTVATSLAIPYWVEVDISSLAGSEIELELDLYDNSGVVGDSWAFIDNVFIEGPSGVIETIDFEDGTLQGFDDSLNPDSVDVVVGDWWSGNYMMRIDEDPLWTPTITYRDFLPSDATTLHMEFEFISDGTVGPWGQDMLVASLLDPYTLAPLITGLTGAGDFLEVSASGNIVSSEVTGIEPIPEPTTIALMGFGILGLLGIGVGQRRKKSK